MEINRYIIEKANEIFEEIVKFRRELHKYPELSGKEYNTQERIIRELEKENVKYLKVADTGVYAYIENGGELVVATRADIDALPILEESSVDFRSLNNNVMHACGHDVHTSVQMGVLKILNRNKDKWNGTIKFFFQPAEETTGGAERMLKDGVNKENKADYFFSFHVAPELNVGEIGVRYGALHACSAPFSFTINGISAHAALAYLGVDTISIAAKVIDFLQTYVSRNIDARDSVVITVGVLNAGTADNVVADKAVLKGTMRFLDENLRDFVINDIKTKLDLFVKSFGATIDIDIKLGYIPVVNNFDVTKIVENNAKDLLGEDKVKIIEKSRMDAEDVGYFIKEIPGTYYRLGIRNENIDAIYDLHHPKFKVDEEAIKIGISMQLKNILEILKK